MEFLIHFPLCQTAKWRVIKNDDLDYPHMQHSFITQKDIFHVGVQFPTNPKLLTTTKSLKQLDLLGQAAFHAIEHLKPIFHRSVINNELIETEGTSLAITGLDSSKKYVMCVAWDLGEDVTEPIMRLSTIRKMWKDLPTNTMHKIMPLLHRQELPPPQMILSNVISAGIKNPIGGLSSGYTGGINFHSSLTVGIEQTCLVVDHRLINPNDEQAFVDLFSQKLDSLL